MRNKVSYLSFFLLVAFAAITVTAQDFKKYEVFGGFTYANHDNVFEAIDDGIDPTISLRGVNAAFTYNFSRYIGAKFDYSLTANRKTFTDPTVNLEVKYKNNQFFGGVQFKDNSEDGPKWKPFGHIMAGLANQRFNAHGTVQTPGTVHIIDASPTTNNFAMIFGGGLDVRVHEHIDIRLVQFDYNPIFFGDQNVGVFPLSNRTQQNMRMSFGLVFH